MYSTEEGREDDVVREGGGRDVQGGSRPNFPFVGVWKSSQPSLPNSIRCATVFIPSSNITASVSSQAS